MSEADIQRQITDALRKLGAFVFRIQSGKVKVKRGWMQLAPEGSPDLGVIVPPGGVFLGLEVKDAKGKLRDAQVTVANALCRAGAAVRTVRSVEDAVRAYLEVKDASGAVYGRATDDE